jgi:4-amino-4-deoxy-L-arabinose transferase-like glycosyltransferase
MTGLVYAVGRRAFGAPTGRWAAAITFLYPTLIFFNFTILTETLFTCLLLGFVWLAIRALDTGRLAVAAACGAALGLAALTRSALWPLPIVLCPAMAVLAGGSYRKRFAVATAVLAGYVLVVGPWAARNTSLQGVVTVVDTMGGMNLRMGNYEHTPDDRMWDAVSLRGSRNWSHAISAEHPGQPFTEGQKDKWGQRKAVQFMLANPMTTIRRAGIKFADFWGLERELIAGVLHGLYSPPRWLARLTAVATIASYVTIVLGGVAAIWLARPAWPVHVLLLVPVIFLLGVHMLAFGHSRYHVPLMPVLSLYAAGLASRWVERPWAGGGWRSVAAALSMAVLIAVWLRQILLVDATRIRAFFDHA